VSLREHHFERRDICEEILLIFNVANDVMVSAFTESISRGTVFALDVADLIVFFHFFEDTIVKLDEI
jgi:hypothetical protein